MKAVLPSAVDRQGRIRDITLNMENHNVHSKACNLERLSAPTVSHRTTDPPYATAVGGNSIG